MADIAFDEYLVLLNRQEVRTAYESVHRENEVDYRSEVVGDGQGATQCSSRSGVEGEGRVRPSERY